MIYIYGLVDPLVHQIAYVGKTNDLYGRWESHVKTEAQHITGQWIQRLRAAGVEPTLVVLEVLPDDGDWMNAERWWISHGLRIGWPLTNTIYAGDRAESNGNAFAESISVWSSEISPQLLKQSKRTSNQPTPISIQSHEGREVTSQMRSTFAEFYDAENDSLTYGGMAAMIRSIFGDDSSTGGNYRIQAQKVCTLLRDELQKGRRNE